MHLLIGERFIMAMYDEHSKFPCAILYGSG